MKAEGDASTKRPDHLDRISRKHPGVPPGVKLNERGSQGKRRMTMMMMMMMMSPTGGVVMTDRQRERERQTGRWTSGQVGGPHRFTWRQTD